MAFDLSSFEGINGDNFLRFIKPVTKIKPFMPVPGEHEKGKKFGDYLARFSLPGMKFYYSFEVNNVHITAINTEVFFNSFFHEEDKEAFLEWLRNDLSQTSKKWKIVYQNRPMYCSMPGVICDTNSKKLRVYLEDIYQKYGVALVLSGEIRTYERLYSIYQGEVDKESKRTEYINVDRPTYVNCGNAGSEESVPRYKPNYKISSTVLPSPGICKLKIDEFFIKLDYLDSSSGKVLDSFRIVKKPGYERTDNHSMFRALPLLLIFFISLLLV